MRLINCTHRDLTLRTVDNYPIHLPRLAQPAARVDVHYSKRDSSTIAVDVPDVAMTVTVEVRPAVWGTDRNHVTPRRRVAVDAGDHIDRLPVPQEGVGLIVSAIVAEQAWLQGRGVDDLFVALDFDRSGGVPEVRSLQPAATASPALQALVRRHAQQKRSERDDSWCGGSCGGAVPGCLVCG